MADTLDFQKVSALPSTLKPNTCYLIQDTDGQHVVIHITDKQGVKAYSTYDRTEIVRLIQQYSTGGSGGVDRKLINRLNLGIRLI